MKFDQIAFRVMPGNTMLQTKLMVAGIYGLNSVDWIHDMVRAKGVVFPNAVITENIAKLAFNYSQGLEIEVIEYLEGINFHTMLNGPISHFGIHMESDEEFQRHFDFLQGQWRLMQRVETIEHTNPYVTERNRTYEYAIFDTTPFVGHFTKLIRRIEGARNSGEDGPDVS